MKNGNYYDITRRLPVARFYYKGTHSHPVRRTVLLIESNSSCLTGYEIREGRITRSLKNAPVKSYTKSKIATHKDLGKAKHRVRGLKKTTLKRSTLYELLKTGA